jgi:hypothetical protein
VLKIYDLVTNELNGCGRKRLWSDLSYLARHFPGWDEGLSKAMKILSQSSGYSG